MYAVGNGKYKTLYQKYDCCQKVFFFDCGFAVVTERRIRQDFKRRGNRTCNDLILKVYHYRYAVEVTNWNGGKLCYVLLSYVVWQDLSNQWSNSTGGHNLIHQHRWNNIIYLCLSALQLKGCCFLKYSIMYWLTTLAQSLIINQLRDNTHLTNTFNTSR